MLKIIVAWLNSEFDPLSLPVVTAKGNELRLWPQKPPLHISDSEFASGGLVSGLEVLVDFQSPSIEQTKANNKFRIEQYRLF